MWKRKISELSMIWGIYMYRDEPIRDIRAEYIGDEYYSKINYEVDKKSRSVKGILILILSLPVCIILIGICVACYVLTKIY